jgi:hypothetical protein
MAAGPRGRRLRRSADSNQESDMTIKSETTTRDHGLRALAAGVLMSLAAAPASAHHGWSWAEDEQTTLEGRIVSVSMVPPHPQLQVEDGEGVQWQVDLGNPSQTERSGFNAESASAGDAITVRGNRNKEAGKQHMKAVRITIDGRNYDLYPERLTTAN